MGVCKLNWCDFVFYTKKDFIVDRIYYDSEFHRNIVTKSKLFFNKYIVRALLQ